MAPFCLKLCNLSQRKKLLNTESKAKEKQSAR
jgi:hypothetical protein